MRCNPVHNTSTKYQVQNKSGQHSVSRRIVVYILFIFHRFTNEIDKIPTQDVPYGYTSIDRKQFTARQSTIQSQSFYRTEIDRKRQ